MNVTDVIAASPPSAARAATDMQGLKTHVLVTCSAGRTVLTPSLIVNNILFSLAKCAGD